MKKLFLLNLAAAVVAFAGCQKNEMEGVDNTNKGDSTFELLADIAQTKTTLDGRTVSWESGDVIYMVTSDGTWGAPYANDENAATVAEFTYAEGKFTTDATIASGEYTFKAMYASASQKSYHRGASSTHKLEAVQTQDCATPTAHIKNNDALVGTFSATVPMAEPAQVTMNHLYTMMQVDVKNTTGAEIEVAKFEMTAAGADLAGVFNVTSFETPTITTKSGASESISVNVTGGTVENNALLSVYFVMAPLADYSGDVTFKVTDSEGNTYSKTVAMNGISFEAGKYNTTPYTISTPDVVPAKPLPFEEKFDGSLGEFTTEGELPTGLSYVWKHDSQYTCAKASAYVNNTRYEQTNYLVSPVLDLTEVEGAMVSFEHAGSYFYSMEAEQAKLCVREKGGEWNELSIPVYFTGWTFVNSGSIDLSSYAGKEIQIGFKYSSTTSVAGTWEIKNVSVVEGTPAPEISSVKTPDMISADGAEASISYSVVNPAAGKAISAATEATWITSFDYSTDGIIKFNVAANTSTDVRSADVTLYYEGAESVKVTVSQAGKAISGTSEVVINLTEQGYANATAVSSVSKAPIEITFDKGTNSNNAPKYYDSGTAVRCYGGNTFTVSTSIGTIVGIEITFGSSDGSNAITVDSGTFASPKWSGSARAVTFTIGGTSGNRRIQDVTITYLTDGSTPDQPILSPRNLSFSALTATATVGEDFVEPTLSGETVGVTYSSTDTGVATVDAQTGVVTIISAGTTTIIAAAPTNEMYEAGEASYMLTVSAVLGGNVVLSEQFDNSTTSDSSSAIGNTKFPSFSGDTSKAYTSKYGGIKLGTSSAVGYITSKSLDLSSAFTVQIDACKYNSDTGNIVVTVDEQTMTIANNQLGAAGTFKTFTLSFNAATVRSTVKIATSSKRAYIDNIVITKN